MKFYAYMNVSERRDRDMPRLTKSKPNQTKPNYRRTYFQKIIVCQTQVAKKNSNKIELNCNWMNSMLCDFYLFIPDVHLQRKKNRIKTNQCGRRSMQVQYISYATTGRYVIAKNGYHKQKMHIKRENWLQLTKCGDWPVLGFVRNV